MKILYHHRTLGDGAEGIHIREMIKAFRQLGHEVRLAGPVGEAVPVPGRSGGFLAKIKRCLPGILFEFGEICYSLFCFFEILLKVWRFRPDFIYDRYITFNFGALLAAKICRVPYFLEVNAPLALERSKEVDEKLYLRKVAFWIERLVCSNASKTIVVSTPLKEYLESTGVPSEKCTVMPNGVDPDKFSPREKDPQLQKKLGIPENALVVGFSGILRPWHGLDMLVEAVGKLAEMGENVFLLIVGDGPIRQEVADLFEKNALLGKALITGRISHESVADYVNLFDVAVSPKATFYASPMKVVEYMALGKAVVVPNTRNFSDMVENNINGISFEDGSTKDLCNVLSLLSDSSGIVAGLGASAIQKVIDRLNWVENARKVCEIPN